MKFVLIAATLAVSAFSETFFSETFATDPFADNRWVVSSWKQDTGEAGKFEWSGGLWGSDGRKGIRTTEDARFYAITAKMDKVFDNDGKSLVFQFSAKHEQKMDCGGGYVKLLPADADVAGFNGDTDYQIMFGPDICGYSTKKVHAILNHGGENLLKKDEVKSPDDVYTHVYTLVLNSDDTYEIFVDGESKASGDLKEAWEIEKPKFINDPDASKPDDWVDNAKMDDPEDTKPDDWDNEPEMIPDPDATKPDDWDDEDDGEWEPPMTANPEYKGVWKAKKIDNPDYKGPWEHPQIENPEYVEVKDAYKRGPLGYVGLEVWQVKSGTVFSNFIVTDSLEEAQEFAKQTAIDSDTEMKAKEAFDEANKEEEPAGEDEEAEEIDLSGFEDEEESDEPKEEL